MPFTTLAGDDVVQLDVYLVERPIADPCINREVWELADEQVLQDRKQVLEENGWRACVLGDSPPDSLQRLLHSERSCANPRRQFFHAGKPTQIVLGPVLPRLAVPLHQEAGVNAVDLDQGAMSLAGDVRLTDDGQITLHFAPQVRHGQQETMPRPVPGPSGELRWDVQVEQPTETYRGLGWEMTVPPKTYVAIGTRLDRPDTLGQIAFLNTEGLRSQRLLVLRVTALGGGRPRRRGARPVAAAGASRRDGFRRTVRRPKKCTWLAPRASLDTNDQTDESVAARASPRPKTVFR